VGTTNLRSQGGLRRCVAFQTHPAHATKEESVEQPWGWVPLRKADGLESTHIGQPSSREYVLRY
jgi:hypothetical protein